MHGGIGMGTGMTLLWIWLILLLVVAVVGLGAVLAGPRHRGRSGGAVAQPGTADGNDPTRPPRPIGKQ